MTSVLKILNEIKSEPSTKKKEDLITKALEERFDDLFPIFYLALDPKVRFGVVLDEVPLLECEGSLTMRDFLGMLANHDYSFTTHAEQELLLDWMKKLSPEDCIVATLMINKDLLIGAGVKIVNKALKKLKKPTIRVLSPLKAYKEKEAPLPSTPFRLEVKVDGARAFLIIDIEKDDAYFLTSTGYEVRSLTHITDIAKESLRHIQSVRFGNLSKVVVDGELVATNPDGSLMKRQKSNGLLNSARSGGLSKEQLESFVFIAWDFLPSTTDAAEDPLYDGCWQPTAIHRICLLENFIDYFCAISPRGNEIRQVESVIVHSEEEAYRITNEWISRGEEGAVAKSLNYPYEPKRSKHLVKLKKSYMADVRITGVNEGKNPGTLGSLSYSTDDERIKGDVSGIKEDLKKEIWENPEAFIGRVIEVRYMEVTKDKKTGEYTLYGPPVFVRFRDDKHETSTFEELS